MLHSLFRFFNDLPFLRELFKPLWDKFLIALVLAYAAFKFNQSLEKYKSRQSFLNEVAKQRVTAVAGACKPLWQFDAIVMQSREVVSECLEAHALGDVERADHIARLYLAPLRSQALAKQQEAEAAINEQQFWLGDELYGRLTAHVRSLSVFCHPAPEGTTVEDAMKRIGEASELLRAS